MSKQNLYLPGFRDAIERWPHCFHRIMIKLTPKNNIIHNVCLRFILKNIILLSVIKYTRNKDTVFYAIELKTTNFYPY